MKIVYQTTKPTRENRIPLKAFVFYIMITLLFFSTGPINYYHVNNYLVLMLFMLASLIISCSLYAFGTRVVFRKPRYNMPFKDIRIVQFSLVYSSFLYLLMVFYDAKNQGINITLSALSGNLFTTMAETYTDVSFITSPAKYLASYTSWIEVIALVGGVYYYKKLKSVYHVCLYCTLALHFLDIVFFVGTQKQIMDIVVYLSIPFIIQRLQKGERATRKTVLLMIISCIILILLFGSIMQARKDLWAVRYNSTNALDGATINRNHIIYKILPSIFADSFVSVMSYISQGYRGLALCLTIPFQWSKGFGSSFKWMNDFSRWFSVPLSKIENSYPVRMESVYGVRAYASWHTIFPWLASDFTWLGAIIIVGVFLYYWGKAWKEALHYDSLPALVFFSQLSILVMYIPCNNQLFQTRASIITTFMIAMIWYLYHGIPEGSKEVYRH